MQAAPKGLRLHIGLFGRRNVGKSSLLNAVTREQVSIVSSQAGTTTDPVEKGMELLPLGPVMFIDTAGIDDEGALGELRISRTRQVFERTDVAVIVAEAGEWGTFEQQLVEEFSQRGIPVIAVMNKTDVSPVSAATADRLSERGIPVIPTVAITGRGIPEVRRALLDCAPDDFINSPAIAGDLVGPGGMAVLVVPIDKEAPKGRLIVPQVQTIRDLLDSDAFSLVVKERELREALGSLKVPPRLVVTDSQAFLKVAADTPPEIKMTSFSILFARFKGNLTEMVLGAMAVETLKPGDRVLIAEACSHHPIADDIGQVKIPRWLTQYVGGKLIFENVKGHDFPEDVSPYRLIVHCGACMHTRREVLNRIMHCRSMGVPISNYGLVIAYSLGIFERALEPFPAALLAYRDARSGQGEKNETANAPSGGS